MAEEIVVPLHSRRRRNGFIASINRGVAETAVLEVI
jgi:hypothetical protein|tara:strand:+ start:1326 stop:1433 length:108 start_codon:yes stop_codon:yes gene_type:complete